FFTRMDGTYLEVILAPAYEAIVEVMSSIAVNWRSMLIFPSLGISAEKEGGQTATAFIPAAFFGSRPAIIKVGISRNPGPTPRNPASIEMGTAKISASLYLSLLAVALTGLNNL
ncbi:MAG: hypothetical protein QXS56_02845, partial [Fervidicoccaceae archaeon]